MAFYRGDEGLEKFKNTASAVAQVAATTSWSLNISKDVIDCTSQGDVARSYIGSVYSGTGSIEMIFTAGADSGTGTGAAQDELLNDIITSEDPADADFELYLGDGTKKIAFGGIVTSADFGTSQGDLQTVSVGFQVSGAIDLSGL